MAGELRKDIEVYADWIGLKAPTRVGRLTARVIRGEEIFSFAYDPDWLRTATAIHLDPELRLYSGPQYPGMGKETFGVFTDSAPDRWGRVLMQRREAWAARQAGRKPVKLFESDYLLGVFDQYRIGGLRFRTDPDGPFLDHRQDHRAPPFVRLRTLEAASLILEDPAGGDDAAMAESLGLLLAPGASLGGARPKASVLDPDGNLWIAKFPSRMDDRDIGGWESVVNRLARQAGIRVAEGQARTFTHRHHTYLTRRFDRIGERRIHFASAMTLMGLRDGAGATEGVSYLRLAECIVRNGEQPSQDLKELWTRIVFGICVSHADDHLRNHGFLLTSKGWALSPAYDLNPVPGATGLHLNITEHDNALDLDLAREVAPMFRVSPADREEIIARVVRAVKTWPVVAQETGLSRSEIQAMEAAFIDP